MRFYNITEDISEKTRNIFPQSQKFNTSNDINDANYFNNVRRFNKDTIFPEFIIHKKAILTDMISAAYVSGRLIISQKLKNILIDYCNKNIQFAPVALMHNEEKYQYWLMNNFESDFDLIDFNESIFKKINGLNNQSVDINPTSKIELEDYINTKSDYEGINISKLVLRDDIHQNLFFIDRKSPPFYFVSDMLKEKIEMAGCTGIKFNFFK